MQTITIELRNVDTRHENDPPLKVTILADSKGVSICPEGYNDHNGTNTPIFLQLYDGKLMLNVWGDINQEDPTICMSLERAKESC